MMNGYKCFYNKRVVEVFANTSYEAQKLAAKEFKLTPGQTYKVTVMLCEKDGEQVTHSTTGI